MSFLISTNKKGNSYDLISVIVYQLIKRVYYESIKLAINIPSQIEVIIDMLVYHHRVWESIITD